MDLSSLKLNVAFRLMRQTLPIILVRLGANLLFWFAAIIYLAIVGGVAWMLGQAIPLLGTILFLVAIGALAPIYHLAYRYVFYMLKAAHIAAMSEFLTNNKIPDETNQLAWGKARVQERFGEMTVMFVIDELVTAVIHAFTSTVFNIANWLPGDTIATLAKIVNRIIHFAMNYIDEAVLARSFWVERDSVWQNARDGVVLYAMIWKSILMNAIALMILSYVPFVISVIIFAAPVGLLVSVFSAQLAGWSIVATLILAWLIKVAVGDSFAMAAIIATYHHETATLTPDPNMTAKIEQLSDKFRDLKQRAEEEFKQHAPQIANNTPVNAAPANTVPVNPTPASGTVDA